MSKPPIGSYNFADVNALLVDDSGWFRTILRQMLKNIGFSHIHEAGSGMVAAEMVHDLKPDLILADWDMERMDGVDFTRHIRSIQEASIRYTPIIMVSAHSSLKNVLTARDAGVTEFLVKPVSIKLLYDRLVAVIEHPRLFIEAPGYIGPDRRRRNADHLTYNRRSSDSHPLTEEERAEREAALRKTLGQDEITAIMNPDTVPIEAIDDRR